MQECEHIFGAGWGALWMILAWIIPALLVVLFIRHITNDHDAKSEAIVLQILESRYARGAIGREEYLKRRADLVRRGRKSRVRWPEFPFG